MIKFVYFKKFSKNQNSTIHQLARALLLVAYLQNMLLYFKRFYPNLRPTSFSATMSKNIKSFLVLLLWVQCLNGVCQTTDSSANYPLQGKWDVLSKVEVQKADGKLIDQDEELYKANEKFFDFSEIGSVTISQGFGKHTEKLPVLLKGNNLYIGKFKKEKIPYLIRYQGDVTKLAKTESRTKKGKTILKTEQVVLQKSKL